ncbi:MAG: ferrous iron transport protein B [Eubacteriales bacterium]|jgi:ferrous iron transport protein B
MTIRLALVGNPNCGKTTMFNDLTGATQYVGNWPGVTVEKKEGRFRGDKEVEITDLPGIYSLSPYTLEEVITRDFLLEQKPDAIVNLVDASSIERNLYLTTQLLEMGIPVAIALNMMDVVRKRGDAIDSKALSQMLGVPVVETSAIKGEGVKELVAAAKVEAMGKHVPKPLVFQPRVEQALAQIEQAIESVVPASQLRWYTIKVFERDDKVMSGLRLSQELADRLETVIAEVEEELDDDAESIITSERYTCIGRLVQQCVKKHTIGMSTSDKIDLVVTNRLLALPIFVAVMTLVYYISISTIGDMATSWTNDVFVEAIKGAAQSFLEGIGTQAWLVGLVGEGIIGGVGAVIGFVPQMLLLFFMLAILEDCGYMARVAFIMDRIFRRFGLSGKSFIPMLIGAGCGVPAVMASRTIEQDRDRKMTIMTTTFIPCGAKMPIVALIAGAVFGGVWWVAPSAYFVGVAAIILSGIILKKTAMFAGDPAPFVMELPRYHIPTAGNVLRSMWERGWSFMKKAGTVILLASILVWFASSFGFTESGFGMVEDMDASVLAFIGSGIAVLFQPLGFGTWQSAVATVLGLVAKEEVVGVFGTLYGVAGDALELVEAGEFGQLGAIAQHFTLLSAYSFLVFNLLCAPCFAAIGAIKREMNNAKWTWFAIGYQTLFAYTMSLMIYQFGLLFTGGGFGAGTVAAIVVLAVYLFLIFRPINEKSSSTLHVVGRRAVSK